MSKSQYLNFYEYSQNDPEYLMRILKDQLFKPKSKIEFKDGSTYHVTKSGSRYWHKGTYIHREDGPSCMYQHGNNISEYYYLFSTDFKTIEQHHYAVIRLNFLREQTNGELESIVEEIARNIQYEDRQKLWRSILQGSTNSVEMIEALKTLSDHYKKLTEMSKKFILDFS